MESAAEPKGLENPTAEGALTIGCQGPDEDLGCYYRAEHEAREHVPVKDPKFLAEIGLSKPPDVHTRVDEVHWAVALTA